MTDHLTYTPTLHAHLMKMAQDVAAHLFTDNPDHLTVEVVDPYAHDEQIKSPTPPDPRPHLTIRMVLHREVVMQYTLDLSRVFWINAHDGWRKYQMEQEIRELAMLALRSHYFLGGAD